jgi:hypothetical protein
LLVAQSQLEPLPMLPAEPLMQPYSVQTLWWPRV